MFTSIPLRARKIIYDLLTIAAIVIGAWQAAEGNWVTFAALVVGGLTTRMASANANEPDRPGPDDEYANQD